MNNNPPKIPLSLIQVEGRLRDDLGDIEGLAESIRDFGLLQPLVVERMQHETYHFALRCGGRRYAALTSLRDNKVPLLDGQSADDFKEASVMVFEEMPPHKRVMIELEENLRRKNMTWQETLKGIIDYHKAAKRSALLEGETWSQEKTGELLNMSQAKVSVAFKVWEQMVAGNKEVKESASLTDAIKVIYGQELDLAQKEQMRRIQLKREEQNKVQLSTPSIITRVSKISGEPESEVDKLTLPKGFTKEEVAAFYYRGNALEVLPLITKTNKAHHIICDPPYGIDMKNLTREDMGRFDAVNRISETHQVEDNLKLLPEFLRIAFDCIMEDGFLCMWYDLDHHEKIAQWGEKIGWRVTRWPLVWCKTSSCLNNAAHCNITKATEVCYFMRRSENSIIKQKQSKNYIEAPSAATSTHPFPKPHKVWKYLLDTVSLPNQTIIDPFAGEGSLLASAFKEGRNPVGIEIDERHIASGLSYVQEQINQKSILDDVLGIPPL